MRRCSPCSPITKKCATSCCRRWAPERRATYSPFLPISQKTGKVLQVPILEWDAKRGTIVYEEDGKKEETLVTGGHCKLQWKAGLGDALAGARRRLRDGGQGPHLLGRIVVEDRARHRRRSPPEGFNYELFLDDQGQKISKSKGNGLSVDEWLTYGTEESLALFMFQKPRAAKRLYFDVIPKAVDDYIALLDQYHAQRWRPAERLENPIWHIHGGNPPAERYPVSFALLLNLVSASNAHNREVLWGFIRAYAPDATPESNPGLDQLVGYAIKYYDDFVKPQKRYRAPSEKERAALADLGGKIAHASAPSATARRCRTTSTRSAKRHGFEPLRDWFKAHL